MGDMIRQNGKFELEIAIDEKSPVPVMFQLYRSIIESFFSLRPSPGMKMPSERKISDTFKINRYTVHSVYQQLEYEGWLERYEKQRGSFISRKARKRYMPSAPCIGIVLPISFSVFLKKNGFMSTDYFKGIIDRAGEKNFSTMIINLPDPDEELTAIQEWLDGLVTQIAGMVYFGERRIENDLPLEMLMKCDLFPQFCISANAHIGHLHSVLTDISQGAGEALKLLIQYGHRSIAFLQILPNPSKYIENEAVSRMDQFIKIAQKAGWTCVKHQWRWKRVLRRNWRKM